MKHRRRPLTAAAGVIVLAGIASGLAWLGTQVPATPVDDLSWGYGVTSASLEAGEGLAALPGGWSDSRP